MANLDEVKDEMIDLIIERQRAQYHSDFEPFEAYKERLKDQYKHWWNDYFSKLSHGYDVILDVINHEKSVRTHK
jgi:deoxyadenosine/deoxycytidine kinase